MTTESRTESAKATVKEDFFRRFRDEESLLQERMGRLADITIPASERAITTDQCLTGISRLSYEVKDASSYLPAYDQRTYSKASSQAIKNLTEKLQGIRSASAPRRKFAFKKVTRQNGTTSSGNDWARDVPAQEQANDGYPAGTTSSSEATSTESQCLSNSAPGAGVGPAADQGSLDTAALPLIASQPADTRSSTAVTISSLSSAHHKLDPCSLQPASSASLTALHHSVIDLSIPAEPTGSLATLTIKSVTESLLICGTVSGAAHITGVKNSTVIITSRQVRMHECQDCVMYLRCSSRPIIEDCNAIRFAPLSSVYESIVSGSTSARTPNLWDQVDDFKWLRVEQSPNWSVLKAEDERAIATEGWKEIVSSVHSSKEQNGLDHLLRAAKVLR